MQTLNRGTKANSLLNLFHFKSSEIKSLDSDSQSFWEVTESDEVG